MAEMIEARRDEFAAAISTSTLTPAKARKEVEAGVDRLVRLQAGPTHQQLLGCQNPVAGPYYNFTVPQATGVVGVLAPDAPSLLGLITMIAAPVCAGCPVVAIASEQTPLPAILLSEVCATSDVPGGVINILTGRRNELLEPMSEHREVGAIAAANLTPTQRELLQSGSADSLKRVHAFKCSDAQWLDEDHCAAHWDIEPYVDMKTIWHPSAT